MLFPFAVFGVFFALLAGVELAAFGFCAAGKQEPAYLAHLEAVEGTNVLNGLVTPEDTNEAQYACRAGAKLVFRGGTKYDSTNNGGSWTPVGAYDVTVEGKPMDVTKVALGVANQDTAFHLNVASNRFPRGLFLWHNAKSNVLYTEVPYALYPDGTGGVYEVNFAQRYIEPLMLRPGFLAGLGLAFGSAELTKPSAWPLVELSDKKP